MSNTRNERKAQSSHHAMRCSQEVKRSVLILGLYSVLSCLDVAIHALFSWNRNLLGVAIKHSEQAEALNLWHVWCINSGAGLIRCAEYQALPQPQPVSVNMCCQVLGV